LGKKIKEGSKVPDFKLFTQGGEEVNLYRELELHKVLLFFYPKDETPGCIQESCKFSAYSHNFEQYGVRLFGVSSDDASSHKKFIEKYDLKFDLLTDPCGEVRKAYGVKNHYLFIPGRETFLIDSEGILLWKYRSLNDPMGHVHESLKFLKKLKD
jgi:peroxiredoxin Q/BCP